MGVLADHRTDPDDVAAPPSAPVPSVGAVGSPVDDDGWADADLDDHAGYDDYGDDVNGVAYASSPLRPDELRPDELRADFGAHFEAHYQRLVAQLYAITLNPAEAHDVVREAYSRAWRRWAEIGASPDPAGWVRRVAVRSTTRSWRRLAARVAPGLRRRALADGGEPRTRAVLVALTRLRDSERRAVVLVDMAGVPVVEVAALERVPSGTVVARLSRGRRVIGDALAQVGPAVPVAALGPYAEGEPW